MATSTEIDYKELMKARLDKRLRDFAYRTERMKRWVDQDKLGGEANRIWAEEQIGDREQGLDICCGDFLVGKNSVGIDKEDNKCYLGTTYYRSGDALTNFDNESCDYIHTNYLEAFADTLKALMEWHRLLKPGGLLVMCLCDTDKYDGGRDPLLDNKNRSHCFTKRTIRSYVAKAGFRDIEVSDGTERSMRVRCIK